jgi:hypothetical protein
MHPEPENERDPLTVTIRRAHELSGYGFTTLWKLVKTGRLKTVRVAGVDRTLITFASLKELLTPSASESATVPPPRRSRRRVSARQASLSRRPPRQPR